MQMDFYSLSALMGAFFGVFILIALAIYFYSAIALMTIAKKTKIENSWLAFIPIANLFLMANIAKVAWWTVIIMLAAGFVPAIGGVIALAITIWWWWKIAEQRNHPGWLGILMAVPLVNLIVIGIIAWAD